MKYLEDRAQVEEFQTADELLAALLDQKADAVFADAPALRYFAAHDGLGTSERGRTGNQQDIGFVFQLGSPLRRQVNHALLSMREGRTYQIDETGSAASSGSADRTSGLTAPGRLPPDPECHDVVAVSDHMIRGAIQWNVITIGVDLAKSVFQVHGVDARRGTTVVRRQLRRRQVLPFFE